MRSVSEARGTHPQRVGNDVGADVGNDVGVKPPPAKRGQGGTGRAAELASEAARAEGASPPRHRPWPARRGPGQAVKDEWLRRGERRGGGIVTTRRACLLCCYDPLQRRADRIVTLASLGGGVVLRTVRRRPLS